MPYAHRKKRIPRSLDRRVKIDDEKRARVSVLYRREGMAQRAIARELGISRRMVSFILFPEKEEACKRQYRERRKDGRYYYGKEKWRKTMREHRHYKEAIKDKLI